jgi:hypothetical protein
MFEKQGKFYADWRDRKGARKRKSFTSARAALRFEEEQKELAHPKPKARANQSPKFSAPKSKGKTRAIETKPQSVKHSSRSPEKSSRTNSARLTLLKPPHR